MVGMMSGVLFAELAGLNRRLIMSVLPKSITTPVAMQIASGLGGFPSMTAVGSGIYLAIIGPSILHRFGIHSNLGKGVALGSASHALGIFKAYEFGELNVSMGSASMTLSAVLGSFIGPLVVVWLHI
ncbi:putative effector of murein hydrolase [Paenibacillus shirakamiensis]|uniref:Effector of murein hydrolase n=1 Tax=Paenibacillus shirakamiensis TaxID=1265935 RepID=A0ABS4JCC4_9BACL|nr:putative effector of murein hydrolase [Paenibacillus shirakamiensis]